MQQCICNNVVIGFLQRLDEADVEDQMFNLSVNINTVDFFDFFQRLDERDFGEQKEINKRKRMIIEGKVCTIFLNDDNLYLCGIYPYIL